MLNSKRSYFSYLINCFIFELINGHLNESIIGVNYVLSQHNLTSNQLFTNTYNSSVVIEDSNENIVQSIKNTTGLSYLMRTTFELMIISISYQIEVPILNLCDNNACINNLAVCGVNHCIGISE
jgi:hypothetical protein